MIIKLFDCRSARCERTKMDQTGTYWNRHRPDLSAELGRDLNTDLRGHRHQLTALVQSFQKHHLNSNRERSRKLSRVIAST